MTRSVPKWIGKTPDTPIPPRVKARVFDAQAGRCADCARKLGGANPAEYDHRVALVNGGANAESNVQALCRDCHRAKTDQDVAEKAAVARKRAAHIGAKAPSRNPLPGGRSDHRKRTLDGRVLDRATGKEI